MNFRGWNAAFRPQAPHPHPGKPCRLTGHLLTREKPRGEAGQESKLAERGGSRLTGTQARLTICPLLYLWFEMAREVCVPVCVLVHGGGGVVSRVVVSGHACH